MAQRPSSATPAATRESTSVPDLGVRVPPEVRNETTTAPPVNSLLAYLKAFGPGIVVALSWVGTGDLIDNSVAGGNYGYALLWVLPLSLAFRFAFVHALGKYPIYNVQRDPSLVRGFARTHRAFAWLIFGSFVLYTHILMAFTLSGVGVALEGLIGVGHQFLWALVGAVSVFLVTFRGVYGVLETIFKFSLGLMTLAFVVGIAMVGIDLPALLKGFAFDLPAQEGLFDSTLIASSIVLATLGSMTSLFYPHFLREKGWTTPAHRRVQRYDLLFGVGIVVFLGVAIWAIGAEVLYGKGGVSTAADIASALETAIGPIGGPLFYLGLLGAAWTTVTGSIFALSKMTVESVHVLFPGRGDRYDWLPARDVLYKVMIGWGLAAVLWSLPGAPDFVVLVVVSHVLTAPFLVVITAGVLVMLNKRSIMGQYTNSWFENAVLGVIAAFVLWAAYNGLSEVVHMVTG